MKPTMFLASSSATINAFGGPCVATSSSHSSDVNMGRAESSPKYGHPTRTASSKTSPMAGASFGKAPRIVMAATARCYRVASRVVDRDVTDERFRARLDNRRTSSFRLGGGGTMTIEPQHHQHDALVHDHKHFHVTHYLHKGEDWTHLLSTHTHDHNHPPLDHVHIPHRDLEKEHRREAHVHDHAGPTSSPA